MARSSPMWFGTLLAAAFLFPICIESTIFGKTQHHQVGRPVFMVWLVSDADIDCHCVDRLPARDVEESRRRVQAGRRDPGRFRAGRLKRCVIDGNNKRHRPSSLFNVRSHRGSNGVVEPRHSRCRRLLLRLRLRLLCGLCRRTYRPSSRHPWRGVCVCVCSRSWSGFLTALQGISTAKVTPIACPVAEVPLHSLRLHFDASNVSYARFQVRGSSAPVREIRELNSGSVLQRQGAFFVVESMPVLPLRLEVDTELDARFRLHSDVMREYGDVGVEHFVAKLVQAPRPPWKQPNLHEVLDPIAVGVGNGSTASLSGPLARTVITTTRPDLSQVITVLESDASTVFDLRPRIG